MGDRQHLVRIAVYYLCCKEYVLHEPDSGSFTWSMYSEIYSVIVLQGPYLHVPRPPWPSTPLNADVRSLGENEHSYHSPVSTGGCRERIDNVETRFVCKNKKIKK